MTQQNTATNVSETADVFKLLKEIKEVNASSIAKAETQRVILPEPPQGWMGPWEPDFEDGYEIIDAYGNKVTTKHFFDAYVRAEVLHFYGKAGAGKSTLGYHLVDMANIAAGIYEKNREIYEENCKRKAKDGDKAQLEGYIVPPYLAEGIHVNKFSTPEDLIGTLKCKTDEQGNKIWHAVLGQVLGAWSTGLPGDPNPSLGKTAIMDEGDTIPPDVTSILHGLFDQRTKQVTLHIDGPMTFTKAPRFRLIVTSNTMGRGENELNFAGTQPQNGALLERYSYSYQIPWMKPASEINLLTKKTGIDEDVAKKMVDVAQKIREQEEKGEFLYTCSTRKLLAWCRECRDEEKRSGKPQNLSDYWRRIAVRSACPNVLSHIDDETTLEGMKRFISVSA